MDNRYQGLIELIGFKASKTLLGIETFASASLVGAFIYSFKASKTLLGIETCALNFL